MNSFVSAFGIEASCPLDGQVINGSIKISNVKFPVENSPLLLHSNFASFQEMSISG